MSFNPKDYPKDWKQTRQRILARADNCCEFCGVENHRLIYRYGKGMNDWQYWPEGMESDQCSNDGYKSTKIILTIAHLDHDKENHQVSDDRLAALCQKCHLGYDMPNHIANRKRTLQNKKQQIDLFS